MATGGGGDGECGAVKSCSGTEVSSLFYFMPMMGAGGKWLKLSLV